MERRLFLIFLPLLLVFPALFPGGELTVSLRSQGSGITINHGCFASDATSQLPAVFVEEHITMTVNRERLSVVGRYRIESRNTALTSLPLLYPFPVDASADFPDSIHVYRTCDSLLIAYHEDRQRNAALFTINPSACEEFVVYYSQRLRGTSATYILTTTRAWKEPIHHAEFTIVVPEKLGPFTFSYTPDTIRRKNGNLMINFMYKDFFPEKDLTVVWKEGW